MEYDDVMVGLNKTRSEVGREPLDRTNGKWEGSPLNGRQVPENLRILMGVALEKRDRCQYGVLIEWETEAKPERRLIKGHTVIRGRGRNF